MNDETKKFYEDAFAGITSNSANPDYQRLAQSNPELIPYNRETGWDKLVSWLGFTSPYERAESQRLHAAANYQAQLEQTEREENYNSEIEQAERQREAGLNPDINGVDPSQASEFQQEHVPAEGKEPSDVLGTLGNIVGVFDQSIGMAIKIADNVLNLKQKEVDLKKEQTGTSNDIFSQIRGMAIDAFNKGRVTDDAVFNLPAESRNIALPTSVAQTFDTLIKDSKLTKRQKSALKDRVYEYLNSNNFASDVYESKSNYAENKKEFNYDNSDPMFNPDLTDNDLRRAFSKFTTVQREFTRLSQEREQISAKFELAKAKVMEDKGADAGELEKLELQYKKKMAELRQRGTKVIDDFNDFSQKGGWFSNILNTCFSVAYTGNMIYNNSSFLQDTAKGGLNVLGNLVKKPSNTYNSSFQPTNIYSYH